MAGLEKKMKQEDMETFIARMVEAMRKEQQNKIRNYSYLNQYATKGQILFTGSSLMEGFPICEYWGNEKADKKVYNRGVGGFTTDDFLENIGTVLLDLEPSKVFINIGTNDMNEREDGEDWLKHLAMNYEKILKTLKVSLPETKVYLMAYYPVNPCCAPDDVKKTMLKIRTKENLELANKKVAELAEKYQYEYIDVNDGLTDAQGCLKEEYTLEGVHMYANAYRVVFENIKSYI